MACLTGRDRPTVVQCGWKCSQELVDKGEGRGNWVSDFRACTVLHSVLTPLQGDDIGTRVMLTQLLTAKLGLFQEASKRWSRIFELHRTPYVTVVLILYVEKLTEDAFPAWAP